MADVRRLQLEHLVDMPSRLRSLAVNVLSEEHSLGHVELPVRPRLQERINLVVQQPAIDGRHVRFERRVRNPVQELRVREKRIRRVGELLKMQNVQADTTMRQAIASGDGGAATTAAPPKKS